MKTMSRPSSSSLIPGYSQNGVLQLIVASGAGFILYHLTRVSFIVFGVPGGEAQTTISPFVGLASLEAYPEHWWTLLTYGWAHNGFFEWVSNMIWLYCFGNVVQTLVGYRQVIPMFIYGLLLGGVFCLLSQLLPGAAFRMPPGANLMTAQPGIMALAAATITISPRYRFYLGEHFSIPLLVVVGIYLVLNLVVYSSGHVPMLMLGLGGLAAGALTVVALKKGYQPGAWMYRLGAVQRWFTPDDELLRQRKDGRRSKALRHMPEGRDYSQKRIDDILDKISQRGYKSLTTEERELLLRASKEEN